MKMKTPPSPTELARQRLEVLYADTDTGGPRHPFLHRLTSPQLDLFTADRDALRVVLDELHRLNLAASIQRAIIERGKRAQKSRNRKAAEPPTQPPTTHGTRQKGSHHK
jgi:hypothetical protein